MERQDLDKPWADLFFEIISLIATERSTDAAVYVSLRRVCRQWRRHLTDFSPIHFLPSPQLPFLLVPPRAIPIRSLGKVFRLPVLDNSGAPKSIDNLPQLTNTEHCICVGSSHGWLIVLGQDSFISLLNPVTADTIPLQPLSSIDKQFLSFNRNSFPEYNLTNKGISHSQFSIVQCCVLSSDPVEDREFTLLLFVSGLTNCCFTLKGRGGTWGSHVHKRRKIKDAVFINGVFVTVGQMCRLYIFDFRNHEAGLVTRQAIISRDLPRKDIFLVNSNGHLLMIFTELLRKREPKPYQVPRGYIQCILYFDHFDLDSGSMTAKVIWELSGIVLFLGHGCSVAVSVQHFPWLMEGSVYFTFVCTKLERVEGQGERLIAFSQGAVYQNLSVGRRSKSTKVFDVEQSRYDDFWMSPRPFWVTPNINRIHNF